MRFSIFPRQNLPEKAVIKKRAHALSVLTVAWLGPSIFAIVAYYVGKEDNDAQWVAAAIWTWRLHGVWAALALVFWLFETPSEVRYVREEWDDDETDETDETPPPPNQRS